LYGYEDNHLIHFLKFTGLTAFAKWVCKINCVIASDSEAISKCCGCFVSLCSTRNDKCTINFAEVLTIFERLGLLPYVAMTIVTLPVR